MSASSQDVVNEALALIGYDGPPVTGQAPNFDSSTPGQIAQRTYPYAVAAVSRLNAWSFPRTVATLAQTGNVPPFPWNYEYAYPANCIDVWQLQPASLVDPYNPMPIAWVRGVSVILSIQSSVIWSNLQAAQAVFNSNPLESTWDPLFRATTVRYLAGELAIAGLGKPDLAALYTEQWRQLVSAAIERTDQ